MNDNLLLMTDSYKASHHLQYPPGTLFVSSYIESRGGKWDKAVFFGLQMFIDQYLTKPITVSDIDEAEAVWELHGEPFNRANWMHIIDQHDGYLPISIQAVPEGTLVENHNVLVQVVNTDPHVPWLTSFLETILLRAVWYPTTVATNSYACKQVIWDALVKTGGIAPAEEIGFKMHDFGARGVSSHESAAIGGAAHLVNFMGTDTIEGVMAARKYYGAEMAGFSVPASEHATITSWSRSGEVDAYRNMLDMFAKPGRVVACVSDSYDIYHTCEHHWGGILKQKIIDSGATLVVRPDSGDPVEVPIKCIEILMEQFGYEWNSKGYRVLPACIRVIQGDGITVDTVKVILDTMEARGLSASNIGFGQGGGLLQMVDRDTLKFAMKCSAIKIAIGGVMSTDEISAGYWRDVHKDPITDTGKRSKRGRLALIKDADGSYVTVGGWECGYEENELREVFRDGQALIYQNFDEIRKRANEEFV